MSRRALAGLPSGTLRFYLAAILWVLRDGMRRYRRRILGLVLLSGVAVAFQGSAFGLVVSYVKRLEGGRQPLLQLGRVGERLGLQDLPLSPLLLGLGALASLSAYAVADYLTRAGAVRLRTDYLAVASRRVLDLAARLPTSRTPLANRKIADGTWVQHARQGANDSSRLLYALVGAAIPALRCAAAFGVMFFLAPVYSLVVAAVTGTGIGLLRQILGRSTDVAYRARELAAPASAAQRAVAAAIEERSESAEELAEAIPAADAATFEYYEAYFGRKLMAARSMFVANLMTALALATLVLVAAYVVGRGLGSWGDLLAALVAMRYFFADLRSLSGTVTELSRHATLALEYAAFVEGAKAATAAKPTPQPRVDAIVLTVPGPSGGPSDARLEPGRPASLYSPLGVGRSLVAILQSHLREPDLDLARDCWWFSSPDSKATTLRRAFAVPPAVEDSRWHSARRQWLGDRAADGLGEGLGGLDTPFDPGTLEALPEDEASVLILLSIEAADRPCVVLDEATSLRMEENLGAAAARGLGSRIFIRRRDPSAAPPTRADPVTLLCDGSQLTGHSEGAWWQERDPDRRRVLEGALASFPHSRLAVEDDE